jgi:hypothetical protein
LEEGDEGAFEDQEDDQVGDNDSDANSNSEDEESTKPPGVSSPIKIDKKSLENNPDALFKYMQDSGVAEKV